MSDRKIDMTELANWIATGMPGNYNALVGYGLNPYDPRPDPREGPARRQRHFDMTCQALAERGAAQAGSATSPSSATEARESLRGTTRTV